MLVEWRLLFSFALFLWLTVCGFFRHCVGFRFFRSRRCLFRRHFIGVAAIDGGIEPRTFKDNSGALAQQPFHLAVAPFFQPAKMLGTFPKGFVPHRLKSVEMLPAFEAGILVGWHGKIAELQSRCVQKQNSSPPACGASAFCRRSEPAIP